VKKNNTFIALCFTFTNCFGQEDVKELHGVITVIHNYEKVNIVNLTSQPVQMRWEIFFWQRRSDILAFLL
jgi:hypothetical protein